MGNKLLIFCLPLILLAANRYPDIDNLIEKVKIRRHGLAESEIQVLKDPFIDETKLKKIVIKQKKLHGRKKQKTHLRLVSIFNNRIKINSKWYTLGAKIVGGYRIVRIDYNKKRVILKKGKKILKLYLTKRKKRFKLVSEGKYE